MITVTSPSSETAFQTTEVEGAGDMRRQSPLFDRLDAFRFVGSGRGRMVIRQVALGRVTLGTVDSTGHDIALSEPGRATFLAPVKGSIAVRVGSVRLEARPGGSLFLRGGGRGTAVRPEVQAGFRALVALAPEAFAPRGRQAGRSGSADDPAIRAMQGYLGFLVRELGLPGSALRRPLALRAADAALLDLFAALALADAPPRRVPLPSEQRVRQAEQAMEAHCDDGLTVADIARLVGVGPRALQLGFQAHRGLSPRAALVGFRLDRARGRLIEGRESVTEVALMCGFAHPGRFAAAYRARFGETPSETLRRSR